MLIHEKMIAIMGDIEAIGKNEKNQMQGFKFRGIDTVYNELHDLFAKHQVFCLPEILEEKSEERTTAKGGNLIYRILKIKYKFVAFDGSFIEAIVTGEAMDSGDKASNKAMAVAHKYVLLQTFMIPTDEEKDPDATTPPESTSKTKTTTPPAKKETGQISVVDQINQSALPAAEKANLIDQYNKKPEHLKKAFYDGCIANRIKQAGKSKTADMVAETFAEKPQENPADALFDDSDVPFDEDEIPPGKDAQPYDKGQSFDEYAKGSKKVGKPAGNLFNTPDGDAPVDAY